MVFKQTQIVFCENKDDFNTYKFYYENTNLFYDDFFGFIHGLCLQYRP